MTKTPRKMPMPESLTFPCMIDIKVFLHARDNNSEWVKKLLLQSIATADLKEISIKESKSAKYHSLSCRVHAQNKTLMDQVFTRLSSHPDILMVL
ncbi:HP0495 family protein [Candidatus Spongiihabitans sp.]|uniref:HP0495 family protein n=1 Tax=Candidatus Spongiihabitans sp. TaxID=3101308 RepID=UPI003C7D4875